MPSPGFSFFIRHGPRGHEGNCPMGWNLLLSAGLLQSIHRRSSGASFRCPPHPCLLSPSSSHPAWARTRTPPQPPRGLHCPNIKSPLEISPVMGPVGAEQVGTRNCGWGRGERRLYLPSCIYFSESINVPCLQSVLVPQEFGLSLSPHHSRHQASKKVTAV